MDENRILQVLELGFFQGVSSCYIAAYLADQGEGRLTTIDLIDARSHEPSIVDLLDRLNLTRFVDVFFEPTSYTWRLMKLLEEDPRPQFDLCYLDGAHSWFVDGFAFFLIDKLLRKGGWIIFDDLDWEYAQSPTLKNTEFVRQMPEDERTTHQVRQVYELLVREHPSYESFMTRDGWAYARKSDSPSRSEIRTETVMMRPTPRMVADEVKRRLKHRLRRGHKNESLSVSVPILSGSVK